MDIKKYEAFLVSAESGSFSAAVDKLGYTPAGIGQMVDSVEESLGVSLLNRQYSGVALTECGKELIEQIRRLVEDEKTLRQTAAGMNRVVSGSVSVGAYPYLASSWIPHILKEFSLVYPNINIIVQEGSYLQLDEWMTLNRIDFALTGYDPDPRYSWIKLGVSPLMLVVPEGHAFSERESVRLEEIFTETFIMSGQGKNHDVERALGPSYGRLNIAYSTSEDRSAMAMVESGLGISIMNKMSIDDLNRRVKCINFEEDLNTELGILVPKTKTCPITWRLIRFINGLFNE